MTPEQIKSFRIRMGMTQAKLAHILGVQQATLNRWEKGHSKPSPLALKRLEEYDTEWIGSP
jgi:putative transcriptional regulator